MHTVAPRLIMVRAPAGMGKTRLLAEVAERARRAGLLTLAGSAFEHEGIVLYGPVRDALADYVENQPKVLVQAQLEALMADLSRILPEIELRFPQVRSDVLNSSRGGALWASSGDDQRIRLFLAVTKSLERIAMATPLVLLLDNLHWADESTLQLLHFVVRQTSHNRMLIVAAYRDPDDREELRAGDSRAGLRPAIGELAHDMQQAGRATILTLDPLAPADVTTLVEDRLRGRSNGQLVGTLYRQSGGNPRDACELLVGWERDLRLQRIDGEWCLLPGRLSPGESARAALA